MTDDIAKLRREVAELRSWVWEVNDILSSASVSVHLREDQPWDSFLFQSHIGGEQRARILLAIEAVLHRAKPDAPTSWMLGGKNYSTSAPH